MNAEETSSSPSTRKHARYPKKLLEYAAVFGQTERTIKRWIRRGKELGDLPPLDIPSAMCAWWRRSMDNQVPDYLVGFVKEAGVVAKEKTVKINGNPVEEDGAPADGIARDFSNIKGLDLERNVEELRRSHAINKYLLDQALHSAAPSEQTIMLRQRNYERSFELLRKSETTLLEFKKSERWSR